MTYPSLTEQVQNFYGKETFPRIDSCQCLQQPAGFTVNTLPAAENRKCCLRCSDVKPAAPGWHYLRHAPLWNHAPLAGKWNRKASKMPRLLICWRSPTAKMQAERQGSIHVTSLGTTGCKFTNKMRYWLTNLWAHWNLLGTLQTGTAVSCPRWDRDLKHLRHGGDLELLTLPSLLKEASRCIWESILSEKASSI